MTGAFKSSPPRQPPAPLLGQRAQSQLPTHHPSVAKCPVSSSGGIRGLVFVGVRVASPPASLLAAGGQDHLKSHSDDRTNPGP